MYTGGWILRFSELIGHKLLHKSLFSDFGLSINPSSITSHHFHQRVIETTEILRITPSSWRFPYPNMLLLRNIPILMGPSKNLVI